MKKMINEIENQRNIKVIWLGLRGSNLKGYAKPDSDVDYLAIFIPNGGISDYLTFEPKNNLDNFTIQQDNFDIQFLELRTAIQSIIKNEVNILQSLFYSNSYDVYTELLKDIICHAFNKDWYMSRMYSILQGYIKKDYLTINNCKDFISAGLIVLSFFESDSQVRIPSVHANNLIFHVKSVNSPQGKLAKQLEQVINNRVNGKSEEVTFEQWELLKKFASLISKPTYKIKSINYKAVDTIFHYLVELGKSK